jgi:hypothetical protein
MATVTLRILASLLLLMVIPGRAQTPAKDTRSAVISDATMRSLLTGVAFDFTEDSSGDSTVFAINLDGHVVTVRNWATGLSLSTCYEGGLDPMKGNQWNRQHFSTRAYINEKGCGSLGSDVSFGGGATNQMIQDFVRRFCTDVAVFARFLGNAPAGPDAATVPLAGAQSVDQLPLPIGAMAWSQLGPYTKRTPPVRATESVPGLLKLDPKVSLEYDPHLWRPTASDADGQFTFSHSSGGARALVISEPTAVPLDAVEDVALANAQSVDPQAKVVFRHRSWNNGVAFWFLKIKATVGTIPMAYWGYFYVGEGGTVQVITYAEQSRLAEYEQDFMGFLNGLSVSK